MNLTSGETKALASHPCKSSCGGRTEPVAFLLGRRGPFLLPILNRWPSSPSRPSHVVVLFFSAVESCARTALLAPGATC
jgi:hypothetical protein